MHLSPNSTILLRYHPSSLTTPTTPSHIPNPSGSQNPLELATIWLIPKSANLVSFSISVPYIVLLSGSVGLGGSVSEPPFWLQLLQSEDKPEFSFRLNPGTSGEIQSAGGDFIFGGIDETLFHGEIEFVDTLDATTGVFWTLPLTGKSYALNAERC